MPGGKDSGGWCRREGGAELCHAGAVFATKFLHSRGIDAILTDVPTFIAGRAEGLEDTLRRRWVAAGRLATSLQRVRELRSRPSFDLISMCSSPSVVNSNSSTFAF